MKTFVIILTMLVAGIAEAQPPKQGAQAPKQTALQQTAPTAKQTTQAPTQTGPSMTTVLLPKLDASELSIKPKQPNEIQSGRLTYSGIAVQVIKCDEPWELINPLAPAEYGSGRQNLDHDLITGKPTAFKIFSISF